MDKIEERYPHGLTMGFQLKRRLFSKKSEFQTVEVVETTDHGRMLFNDGCAMLSERDEAIYHEMMAHVPLYVHPNPETVLIVGGGDGGTAREVLRHPSVKKCVMVEIDSVVVDACKEFIPQTASCLADSRLKLIIDDGVKFVAETDERFDVVLIDSTDPVGPAQPLFGVDFYRDVNRVLKPNGIVVAQGETPFYEIGAQRSLMGIMGKFFEVVKPYNFTNMTYPGGLWSFIFASKSLHPQRDFVKSQLRDGEKYYFYNADLHLAAFALPSFMLNDLHTVIKGD